MKKLFALLLALALIASCCFCVMADEEVDEEPEEDPESYFWIKDESTDTDVSVTFFVPGEKFTSDTVYKITAHAKFDGCEGTVAYVNCYVYDVSGNLVSYSDFASAMDEATVDGKWADFTYEFNPCDGSYGDFAGKHIALDEVGYVTFGVGFYQATGIVNLKTLQLNQDVNVVWAKGFASGLDIDTDADIKSVYGVTAADEGISWGVVRPEIEDNGNIADEAEIDCPAGGGAYTASLNDGVAFGQTSYDNNWFGFARNTNVELIEYQGESCYVGTVTFDLGKVTEWTAARAHIWDGAGNSGIATPYAINVSYSDNNTDWTEFGNLNLGEAGEIYWAEKEADEAISSRYVRFQLAWTEASACHWFFVNELEIIGADVIIDDPDESSEPAEESKTEPKEESKQPTPKTGDAGMIALAVVSVIALAGVAVVKKSK